MVKLLKIKIFVFSVLILFSSTTCRKDNFRFPYTTIYANMGLYNDLSDLGIGSVKIFPPEKFGGIGGLIVYREDIEQYFVFDAACTYDYQNGCSVDPDADFLELMVCPCCSSSYLLSSEGIVFNGPAIYPLVQYQSSVDGSVLRVWN